MTYLCIPPIIRYRRLRKFFERMLELFSGTSVRAGITRIWNVFVSAVSTSKENSIMTIQKLMTAASVAMLLAFAPTLAQADDSSAVTTTETTVTTEQPANDGVATETTTTTTTDENSAPAE